MDPCKENGQRRALFESLFKIPYPLSLRNYTDVHSTEHVQSPPNPLRIPEQPTEHAPFGSLPSPPALSALLTPLSLGSSKHYWKWASTSSFLRYA